MRSGRGRPRSLNQSHNQETVSVNPELTLALIHRINILDQRVGGLNHRVDILVHRVDGVGRGQSVKCWHRWHVLAAVFLQTNDDDSYLPHTLSIYLTTSPASHPALLSTQLWITSEWAIGVNTGGGGTRPPRIRSGRDANVIRPTQILASWTCCVMNHSAVHRCQASPTAHRLVPTVGWHAL